MHVCHHFSPAKIVIEKAVPVRIENLYIATCAHTVVVSCRCIERMEKLLAIMQAMHVTQGVAETLLDNHNGDPAAAVGAALDGLHG